VTAESGTHTWNGSGNPNPSDPSATPTSSHVPELVLCALDESLAQAWHTVADAVGDPVRVHRGSVLDIAAQAVVSPANSYGWMRGGIDAVYAQAFPGIEQQVRSIILAYHGGELPIGEAVVVPTGEAVPEWLISAPTMREPGERLPDDTVHPYLAAKAVFLLWRDGQFEHGTRFRDIVKTIAMPGLGTGVGGVSPATCARQVAAAWEEVFPKDRQDRRPAES
jgi:O-acetyl-ADP-ribose deacetylase (regulator of RNase III)